MSIKYLSRRQFIKGLGATWLGMPLLEVMLDSHGEAYAATGDPLPRRYVVMFCGLSTGSGGPYPIDSAGKVIGLDDNFAPKNIGANYDIRPSITPLTKYGVQSDVTVLSNMLLPSRNGSLSFGPGPGEFQGPFHGVAAELMYTGVRTQGISPYKFGGESSDQIVAKMHAAKGYAGITTLNYRIQASSYLGGGGVGQTMSRILKNGVSTPVTQEVSPRNAFNRLTTNFKALDPAAEALRKAELAKRKSVLDLVQEQLDSYMKRLPTNDQKTLSNWADGIRSIEKDLERLDTVAGGSCKSILDPGPDPAIGGSGKYDSVTMTTSGYTQNNGYSNEILRGKIFNDLIQMAFACDMSRVATVMITVPQCNMNAFNIAGITDACHGLTHGLGGAGPKGYPNLTKFHAWNVDFFAQLIKKLKDTPDGSGTLIDNSAVVYFSEGGIGNSSDNNKPQNPYYTNKNLKVLVPHTGENFNVLVGGRAGGLKHGIHIRTNQEHACRALITAMKAVGVTGDKLGEVSGLVPGLI